jgi:tetratricopeptide (TPR) repeat protein
MYLPKQFILLTILLFFSFNGFSQDKDHYYKEATDLYDSSNYNNALKYVDSALVLDPVDTVNLLLRGNTLQKLQRFQESFDTYSKIISIAPYSTVAYNQRGLLLMSVRQPDDAITDFTTALKYETKDSLRLSLLVNRGAARINIRDFPGAYDDFKNALQIDSLDVGTLNNLATVCDEVGKGDETLKYLYKIISIDSTFDGVYVNIGFKYENMGDYRKAIGFFNKELSKNKTEPLSYSNKAFCEYKIGELKDALADINISIRLYPGNSYAFRTRALIYLALKKKSEACSDISEALDLGFAKMYGNEVDDLKAKNCK